MFLAALAGFVVCSAAAGAAQNEGMLVAARLAQGIAAGALAPQNSALIQQLFRGAERGRAFGFFGATVGISTAAGPVLGGVILALAGAPADGGGSSTSTCPSGSSPSCSRRGCFLAGDRVGAGRSTSRGSRCSAAAYWP